jgi:PKD repeat protein
MKRWLTVLSALGLGLFFVLTVTTTQAAAPTPIDRSEPRPHAVDAVKHTQPITPGAPVDAVLVLDRSESQSYDFASLPSPYSDILPDGIMRCYQSRLNDMYACLNGGTLSDGTTITGCNNEPVSDPNFPELTHGICQPFRKSKEAAYRFIQQLRPGIDRMALINFAETPTRVLSLTLDFSAAISAVNSMDVYVSPSDASQPNPTGHILCNFATSSADFWKCGSSNIGGGLLQAINEFSAARAEAKWSAVLIVDGGANRTSFDPRIPWSDPLYGTCPSVEQMTPLKCRDYNANSRHFVTPTVDPLYDADDYAREYGDLIGLDPNLYPSLGSAGIQMFTIGFGWNTVCNNGTYTPPANGQPATCTGSNPVYGDPDAGEQLLRYIADMGDDGNLSTGPCLDTQAPFRDFDTRFDPSGRSDDVGLGLDCGNYRFSPDAASLPTITVDIAQRILANTDLIPEFSALPLSGVAPLSVTFDNLSTGPYTSTLWTFGDGDTSTVISPTHLYMVPGVYTVTLTIANITTTISLTRSNYITVCQLVAADFSATPLSGTAPLTVTFTNQSTGDYTDALWSFGDGMTSTLINPTHTYGFAGSYTVTLQASGLGGTDEVTRPNVITVYQAVHADFSATPLSGIAPLTVTFTNQSTTDYTDALWIFGDGITSTLINPTHTYALAGAYTVTLQASGLGGTDEVTRPNTITVYQPVTADFSATPLSGTAPLIVTFTNQSTGDYTDALWNFGDGITSTLLNPTHTYGLAGVYTVTLQASGLGGTDVFTHPNATTVYQSVHADFSATPLSGTAPLTVTFTDQSTGDYTDLLWNFGDSVTSTLINPTHKYAVGIYTVTLYASGLGGTGVFTRTNYINVSAPRWHVYLSLIQNSH